MDNPALEYYKQIMCVQGGKVNTYRIFIERGIRLLAQRGYFSYINPNTYLTSSDSYETRKYLLENTELIDIVEYPERIKIFTEVTQAVTTLVLRNFETGKKTFRLKTEKQGDIIVDQTMIHNNGKFTFIPVNSVVSSIRKANLTIGSVYEGFQGEVNVSTKKDFFVNEPKEGFLPLLRGNMLSSGYISPILYAEYCDIDAIKRDHYKRKRVAIQEVSNQYQIRRLKATIVDEDILLGHTTNYFLETKPDYSLYFLCGLLNSKVLNYYFKYFNTTNHLPIGELLDIPIPEYNKEPFEALSSLVSQILAIKEKDPQADTGALEKEIDQLVYKLYELTDEEIE
jgi:Alw26I/Eco31I/Esp3I family type II restriction m6 adenine DNA methyltransferase